MCRGRVGQGAWALPQHFFAQFYEFTSIKKWEVEE